MFAWILTRVERKLEGWKERLISKVGKEVLIKTVIQALPQYAMAIFKIPLSICRTIEQQVAYFGGNKMQLEEVYTGKKWEYLKNRKDCDGLGFKDLVNFNKAMLGKQAWRFIQTPDALWCKVLKSIYFLRGEFWTANKGF